MSAAQVLQLNRQDNNTMAAETNLEGLPDPMTPRDCDLSDMPYMPLDVAKFTRSRALAIMPPEYALPHITLWAESWREVPCGSLPNDDFELATLAGYGRDLRGFTEGKEHIMSKWTLCSDGRYYHGTIAARALETWVEKLAYKIRSAKGNAARNKTDFNPVELFEKLHESMEMLRRTSPNAKRIMTGFPEKHLSGFAEFASNLNEKLLEGTRVTPIRKANAEYNGVYVDVNAPNINSKVNSNSKDTPLTPQGMAVQKEVNLDEQEESGNASTSPRNLSPEKPEKKPARIELPASLNHDAWTDYKSHRKQTATKRKPFTALAAQKAVNLLGKHAPEVQQQMVDESIMGGWTGLFPPKNPAPAATKQQPEKIQYYQAPKPASTKTLDSFQSDMEDLLK